MSRSLFFLILLILTVSLFGESYDWSYAYGLGGIGSATGNDVISDANGNYYIIGDFRGYLDFPDFTLSSPEWSFFIAKADSQDNWLWAEQPGTDGSYSYGGAVTLDNEGNLLVTGRFRGTIVFGDTVLTNDGIWNHLFIAKGDGNGNWFWAVSAGSDEPYTDSYGIALTTDSSNNIYLTGSLKGSVNFGSYTLISGTGSDILVAKLDPEGNWLWVERAGGDVTDHGNSIALDTDGNIIITGNYSNNADFGSDIMTSGSLVNAFIAKLDTEGNWLWVTAPDFIYEGPCCQINIPYSLGCSVLTDESNNVIVCGIIRGTFAFGTTEHSSICCTTPDIYVSKLTPAGEWIWSTSTISTGSVYVSKIKALETDSFALCGNHQGAVEFGNHSLIQEGSMTNNFIASISTNGNWRWVKGARGTGNSWGNSLDLDTDLNITATGYFMGVVEFGEIILAAGSPQNNVFVVKLERSESSYDDCSLTPLPLRVSCYPNPFNPQTTIAFSLPEASDVVLSIYNLKGQLVNTLIDDYFPAGEHRLVWQATDRSGNRLGTGIYLYKLQHRFGLYCGKMLLLK